MVLIKDVRFPHQKKRLDTRDTVTPKTSLLVMVGGTTKRSQQTTSTIKIRLTVASDTTMAGPQPHTKRNGPRRSQTGTTVHIPTQEQNLRRRHGGSSSMSRKGLLLGRTTCRPSSAQPTTSTTARSKTRMCRSTRFLPVGVISRASPRQAGSDWPDFSPFPSGPLLLVE